MKLKTTQVKPYREKMLAAQNYKCGLCGLPITDNPVLDHDHKTGAIRSVLHNACNRFEGIIVHWAKRTGVQVDLETYLLSLIEYHKLHAVNQTGDIHPSHLTDIS